MRTNLAVAEGLTLAQRQHRRTRAVAFALAALVLYVPANALPILEHATFGRKSTHTILSGVEQLFSEGDVALAVIVFVASIAVPLVKIFGILALAHFSGRTSEASRRRSARAHRLLEIVGPWSMLDVFLLAVAISIVRFGDLTYVVARNGIFAFAAVVVLTILATQSLRGTLDEGGPS